MASTKTRGSLSTHGQARVEVPRSTPASAQTTFLGREQEIAELSQLSEGERLITFTGAPGIGKSRLAIELTAGMRERYPRRGVRLVELAPISHADDVARAVASALPIDEVSGQSLTDTLVARLRRRRVLLVLDNCEHLLGACAELADTLLEGCPQLRLLATSREPLRAAGERVWQVPPLSVPQRGEQALPARLLAHAAVTLFVERARAVQPSFALNAYVAPAVAEICRRLDGIPLAIELAAARVETLTPEEIARRLEDRFGLLTEGSQGGLPRHQTLEAALDWSHELLAGPERALLRRLSVFVGGFVLEAAEAVCAGGEVEREQVGDLLVGLVAKSLVTADTGSLGAGRFRLLETIRAYALGKLEEARETAGLRAAHARFFLELAERAEPELTGPRQQDWFERLEAERASLRSALEWSLGHGEAEQALRLAGALVLFWRVRCHFSEGRELLDAALSAGDGAPAGLRAKALWGAGFMRLMGGDPEGSVPSLEESLAGFRELGDRRGCARTLLVLGNSQSDIERALSLFEESVALAREAGDSWCLAHALVLAGACYRDRDRSRARTLLEESLSVARGAEDKQGQRFGLQGLGTLLEREGDLRAAESLLAEAVAVNDELGEDYLKATTLQQLGQIAISGGHYGRAAERLEQALDLMREIGEPLGLPFVLALRGGVAHAEGELSRARSLLEEALALYRSAGRQPLPALQGLAELNSAEGQLGAARRLFEEALELARGVGNNAAAAQALIGLGQVARGEGELKRARSLHIEAFDLGREIGGFRLIAVSLEAIAGLAVEAGRFEQAARLFGAAKALRDEWGYAARWGPSRYDADLALIREALSREQLKTAFAAGAALSLEQVAAEVSQEGAAVAMPEGGWESLTDIERQVAALVAEQLTNRQIAERLFISYGTVKFHLTRIYRKLGLKSRTKLALEVARRGQERLGSDR